MTHEHEKDKAEKERLEKEKADKEAREKAENEEQIAPSTPPGHDLDNPQGLPPQTQPKKKPAKESKDTK